MTNAIARLFPLLAATVMAALIFAGLAQAAPKTVSLAFEGVGDGDTIYVRDLTQKASYRVRLAMIDAPEKNQSYGMEAKNSLEQLLRGAGTLKVTVYGTDQYKRLIGVVYDERGQNINMMQVSQGAAWIYEQYAKSPAYSGLYGSFANAERNARMRRMGLWAETSPMEPWKFRRN